MRIAILLTSILLLAACQTRPSLTADQLCEMQNISYLRVGDIVQLEMPFLLEGAKTGAPSNSLYLAGSRSSLPATIEDYRTNPDFRYWSKTPAYKKRYRINTPERQFLADWREVKGIVEAGTQLKITKIYLFPGWTIDSKPHTLIKAEVLNGSYAGLVVGISSLKHHVTGDDCEPLPNPQYIKVVPSVSL